MKKEVVVVLVAFILGSTLPLGAIKPTRSFVDFLNRIEWHAYSKDMVHRSLESSIGTGLIAGSVTCYLAKRHRAQESGDKYNPVESERSSDSSGSPKMGWFGGAALLAACVATKKVATCCRLWKIIKTSNMPTVRSEQFQASLTLGMQPNQYYWVSKPLKNLFWS